MSDPQTSHILGPRLARTFYNVLDALEPGSTTDPLPELERALRHEGLPAIRRTCALLWLIEREPRLRLRGGFSQLGRVERAALLEGWRGSRLGLLRRALAALEGRARSAAAQSSPGA